MFLYFRFFFAHFCLYSRTIRGNKSIPIVFVLVLYLLDECLQVNVSKSAAVSKQQRRVVNQKSLEQWLGHNHDENFNES